MISVRLPLLLSCLALTAVATPAAAIEVSVRLTPTRDAILEWQAPAVSGAAGHIVEYINHPTDEWVILGFVPASRRTFTHPRLAPATPYSFRLRPIHGPVSAPVTVTIADGLSDAAYAKAYAQPEDYSWAPPEKKATPGGGVFAPKSIRLASASANAAPANFKAEIIKTTVSGFRLTWTDRSSDEEGFLLERVDSDTDFTVCAMIEPDINTFGWALEPPARQGTFRIRAYRFGAPSPIASIVTPVDPHEESAPIAPKPKT